MTGAGRGVRGRLAWRSGCSGDHGTGWHREPRSLGGRAGKGTGQAARAGQGQGQGASDLDGWGTKETRVRRRKRETEGRERGEGRRKEVQRPQDRQEEVVGQRDGGLWAERWGTVGLAPHSPGVADSSPWRCWAGDRQRQGLGTSRGWLRLPDKCQGLMKALSSGQGHGIGGGGEPGIQEAFTPRPWPA